MMSVKVICGSCGHVLGKMHNLKSVKEVLGSSAKYCEICGKRFSATTEFVVKATKLYSQ
jgi:hypothetical protein